MSSLRFVLGRAGSGKSEYIIARATETEKQDKNAVIIVPEQYSHAREMQILSRTGYICENLYVTSFNRLAKKIISESGKIHKRLDSTVKAMLMSRALLRLGSKLTYFKNATQQPGYIQLFLDAVSEFKKGGVTPEALHVAAQGSGDSLFCARINDISLVYAEYDKMLSAQMWDSDDDIALLSVLCAENEYIKNSVIYIDEFFRFTQTEILCIEAMMAAGADVVVSLCMPGGGGGGVFASVSHTKHLLERCAQNVGAELLPSVVYNDINRFKTPELHFLERAMSGGTDVYTEPVENITLSALKNRYDEVAYVAAKIRKLIKEGIRFSDIAVITGDYEGYKDVLSGTFGIYDIPVFADTRKKFLDHPIVVYLFSVFDLLTGITTDRVIAYMKSGFADVSHNEASRLENYAFASAINYNDWLNDERFLKKSTGIFATEEEAGEEGKINLEIKNRVLLPIVSLKEKILTSRNVSDRVDAFSEFFAKTGLEEKIKQRAEEFSEEGKLNLADEYTEVYEVIRDTFDALKSCLGDENAGINTLREIITAGFSQRSLGVIPKVCDSVSFGDINRSVIKNPRVLFLIGVNEGCFPAIPSVGMLLSDEERQYLTECGISVAPDSKKLIEATEFSMYESVNAAREKIFVSYPIDNDGISLRPAGFTGKLKRVFSELKTDSYLADDELPAELSIASKDSAYTYVLTHITSLEKNSLAKMLSEELSKDEVYKAKIERAKRFAAYENTAGKLSEDSVRALYGNSLYGSVSRFERFASCPFSFFVEYGLRARERKVLKVEAPDVGSLLHEVVELFSKEIRNRNMSFKTVTKKQQTEICDEIIEDMFERMMVKKVFSAGRIEALKKRLKSLVAKSVWAICEHVARGEFEPAAFELSFEPGGDMEPVTVTLPTGEEITMIGRIDRVDTYSHEGKLYVKIIDYKSGNKAYSLADIFNMTTLQLSVYMIAATENGKKVLGSENTEFGGMFYFKLDDPVESSLPDEIDEEKSLKAFKMSGLVADNPAVVSAMDKNADKWSAIIPVYVKSDGELSKSQSKLANPEQYEKLKKHVKTAISKIGKEILSGNIDIHPVRDGDISPCSYCRYRSICGFDINEHICRYAKKFSSDEEIWNEL